MRYFGESMTAIIIGAGASGLACAVRLKQKLKNADVTVLERLESPGRRILATGNGRCNIISIRNSFPISGLFSGNRRKAVCIRIRSKQRPCLPF